MTFFIDAFFVVRLTLPEGMISHNNIKCIGRINRMEMQHEYQSGTLLFPSFIETVGLPLLEGRSCKTMILASDTPFCHECLENYENVRYFSPFDANALKDYMKAIIKNNRLSLKSTIDSQIDRPSWKEFYDEVLSCKKSFL